MKSINVNANFSFNVPDDISDEQIVSNLSLALPINQVYLRLHEPNGEYVDLLEAEFLGYETSDIDFNED